jgi:hypothetical protein
MKNFIETEDYNSFEDEDEIVEIEPALQPIKIYKKPKSKYEEIDNKDDFDEDLFDIKVCIMINNIHREANKIPLPKTLIKPTQKGSLFK